jgi:hypothetical protein
MIFIDLSPNEADANPLIFNLTVMMKAGAKKSCFHLANRGNLVSYK